MPNAKPAATCIIQSPILDNGEQAEEAEGALRRRKGGREEWWREECSAGALRAREQLQGWTATGEVLKGGGKETDEGGDDGGKAGCWVEEAAERIGSGRGMFIVLNVEGIKGDNFVK